jgi:hypothetical protein
MADPPLVGGGHGGASRAVRTMSARRRKSGFAAVIAVAVATVVLACDPGALASPGASSSAHANTGTGGFSSASADCSTAEARALVNQYHLNLFLLPQPVAQVLCGPFTGPSSKAMAVTIGAATCWNVQSWAVFRFSAGTWKLVFDDFAFIFPLVAVGADIKETTPVFRSTDPRCVPSGGKRARVWHWNGTKLTAGPWHQVAPGAAPAAPTHIAGDLSGVAATSASNAWAVGITGHQKTLIVHWNGTAWTQVPSPSPGPEGDILSGVAATSADSAWAVGYTGNGGDLSSYKTLILHWNGAVWKQVPSPSPAGAYLTGVAATSATNAWAVGSVGYLKTLILHWNGKVWKQVSSPNPEPGENIEHFLTGVAVTSASNAWAVGGISNCGCGPATGLILHWNGSTWKQVPNSGSGLRAVAASAGRAWVVGGAGEGDGPTTTLALRWNDKEWKQVPSPSSGTETYLTGVAVASATNAWAVGSTSSGKSLIVHWNGTAWTQVPSPGTYAYLTGVAATSADNAWAVGGAQILHWNGTAWK